MRPVRTTVASSMNALCWLAAATRTAMAKAASPVMPRTQGSTRSIDHLPNTVGKGRRRCSAAWLNSAVALDVGRVLPRLAEHDEIELLVPRAGLPMHGI